MSTPANRARRRAAGAVLAAVLAVAAACGLPNDDEPRVIESSKVPFNLLVPNSVTQPTESQGRTFTAGVYFVLNDHLQPVDTNVPTLDAEGVLTALLAGPPAGLTTTIPSGTQLLSAEPDTSDPTVLVINLSSEFFAVVGHDQLLGYGQLVFTATELKSFQSVRFLNDGQAVPALTEGPVKSGPVSRADYPSLGPPSGSTTTSTTTAQG